MSDGPPAGRTAGTALLIVRNAFQHDARVLRAARTLAELGFDATVLAVVARGETSDPADVRVERIAPASRLERAVYRRTSGARSTGPSSAREAVAEPGGARSSGRGRAVLRRLMRWATTLGYYRRAIAYVRELRPDLVHCNDYNTMWIGVAARYLVGSVVIYDSHELWPDRNLRPEPRWWLLLCEALFVRVAHEVVMTSPAHAAVMARRYRVREPTVVRNIPDGPASAGARARHGSRDGRRVAAYVGGLLRNRGLEESIAALPRVPGAALRLIGPVDDAYRRELQGLADSLGVGSRLELPGPVPPTKVVESLAGADVGIALFQPNCLSHRLVLPNKLFEYVMAGLPVLGSDLPMIARFIREHEVGVAVHPGDVGAVAAGLEELLEPERNARYREAAVRAAGTLDWRREQELMSGVYRAALSRAAG